MDEYQLFVVPAVVGGQLDGADSAEGHVGRGYVGRVRAERERLERLPVLCRALAQAERFGAQGRVDGRALLGRVMPGHIQVTRLLLDPLSDQDVDHLRDIMTRVRDHMRAQPPRSAAPRKRRG